MTLIKNQKGFRDKNEKLTTGNNLHNFQPVARVELPFRELGRRDGLTVVLHHYAAG